MKRSSDVPGIGGFIAHPSRVGDREYNEARANVQKEHKYRYEPREDGYAAVCGCGKEFTADTRERVSELIGGHVERLAERAGRQAREDAEDAAREAERERRHNLVRKYGDDEVGGPKDVIC